MKDEQMPSLNEQEGDRSGLPVPLEPCLSFSDCCLFPTRRQFFRANTEVQLRGREFDLLYALVENAGTFLSNDVLIARIWPTSTVSESNLRVQMASLRRALGDNGTAGRMIVNVTGRGYSFTLPVVCDNACPIDSEQVQPPNPAFVPVALPPSAMPNKNLPNRLSGLIGREPVLTKLLVHMPHRRLLTIVGPGGIGKTSLSMTLAERLENAYEDGVYFVDLATIPDASTIVSALTKAFNLRLTMAEPMDQILEWLSDRHVLVVLDNCEHVIERAAELVEEILRGAPRVHMLCTSREALRVDGEWIHRLAPLDSPPQSDSLMADEAIAYSAIELFVERAIACRDLFVMSDEDAAHVAKICRSLDGIPLAIELAAARVDRLNVRSLAALLPDRLELLGPGKRTAKPHQQTLRATLDWSYQLLDSRDRITLNRLSIFRNSFTLEAVFAVAGFGDMNEGEAADSLFELVGKSMVTVETVDGEDYYRLLETTRAYASEKLLKSGEHNDIAGRHALLCREILLKAKDDRHNTAQADWVRAYGRWMDDVRAALDWTYSGEGNVVLGIELSALSSPLASRLALLREYLGRIEYASDQVRMLEPPNPFLELRVNAELAYLLQHTSGDTIELRRVYDRVTQLQLQTGDAKERFEAIHFDFGMLFSRTDWNKALEAATAAKITAAVPGEPYLVASAERMRAQAFHYLARHREAVECGQAVLTAATGSSLYMAFTRVDPRISARAVMARSLWLLGECDNAVEVVHDCLAFAEQFRNHPLCQGLAMGAVPVAAWSGDTVGMTRYANAIVEVAIESGMDYWIDWGHKLLLTATSRPDEVSRLVLEPLMADDLATYNRHLVTAEICARFEAGNSPWAAPEIFRGYTANLFEAGAISSAEAEARLHKALDLARSQEACYWELRIINDLAAMQLERQETQALRMIERLLARLRGASDSADVKRAIALLSSSE